MRTPGNCHTPRSPSGGFTLLELIAVIAIIAIIGSLVVVSANSILKGIGERPVEEIFRLTLREARFLAASEKETVQLRYDHEKGLFLVQSEAGRKLYERETGYGPDSSDIDIRFLHHLSGTGLDPDDGDDWVEGKSIFFRPDRSSTPFEVIFDLRDAEIRQRYDPFSDIIIEEDSR